jgi:branched-subunit amino acid aminotransferase/4-amino-4-deoxychorismate lyase
MSIVQAAPSIGIPVSEEAILPEALFTADEIFVCHTGIKVLPVNRFEDRTLEAPGPITRKVMEVMQNIFSYSDTRFKDWFFPL